jgi:uncharacterized protein
VTIGLLHLDVLIPGAHSLKDKRRVVKSLKERMGNRFNCSVAETDHQDLWQRARISVAVISNDSRHANQQCNEIARFALSRLGPDLADYQIEML